MPLLQTGRDEITSLICGASTGKWDSRTWTFVGSGTGAHAGTQTYLLTGAAATQSSQESGYPQQATNVLTYRSVFSTAKANWDWNEWALKNSSASSTGTGAMLNRMQEALGLKASTQSWQLTMTITITT